MPRAARILGNDITYHVVANCNAKEFLFRSDPDFEVFQEHLRDCQHQLRFDLHAYSLMQSHIHLILTTREDIFLDKVMYEICQRFSFRYNRHNNREGHFWKNRYFSKVISSDAYGLCCLRYLHINPTKANIVEHPLQWRWSCARFYMLGEPDPMITPLPSYLGLGPDSPTRQRLYTKWVETDLLNQKVERALMQGRLRIDSRRFNRLLKNDVEPVLNHIRSDQ